MRIPRSDSLIETVKEKFMGTPKKVIGWEGEMKGRRDLSCHVACALALTVDADGAAPLVTGQRVPLHGPAIPRDTVWC